MKLTEFFNNDYVDQASYDNLRKIASVVDGQKNAARKIIHTFLDLNINTKIKVSQCGSKVSEYAEYLHGEISPVLINLAQDYIGTNNVPLLQKMGNFGTRFAPEPSAARYIHTKSADSLLKLFDKTDKPILKHQYFEGKQIEPMFFVPNMPVLLLNGSEGVSSGFAQKILPRNPQAVKQYILNTLNNKKTPELLPFYNGFNGDIVATESKSQFKIKGRIKRLSINSVEILEVPIGYSLKSYIKVLDDLEDDKTIQSYTDLSEYDNFNFKVKMPSKELSNLTDDELLVKLKLVKTVTENYTVINENNKIQVFDNIHDVIDKYIQVKLHYTQLKKDHMIKNLTSELLFDTGKLIFVSKIIANELIINNKRKKEVVKDLDGIDEIIKRDGSYDYLLNMNILSLTMERVASIKKEIKNKTSKLKHVKKTSVEQLWTNSLI